MSRDEIRFFVAGVTNGTLPDFQASASVCLGAGCDRVADPDDAAVGILVSARPGDAVRAGDPLLDVHCRDRARLDTALPLATFTTATVAGSLL